MDSMYIHDEQLVQKWGPVLEGIKNDYTKRVTAQLLENQAKAVVEQKMVNEATTEVGSLGTFAKFAFPLVRRVYPELIAQNFVGVQPMQGPVSQVFYLGHSRQYGTNTAQTMYSKFNLTPYGNIASGIGSVSGTAPTNGKGTFAGGTAGGLDGDVAAANGFDVSNLLSYSGLVGTTASGYGWPASTMGGRIAAFPNASATFGWVVSAGERLDGTGIPELSLHIEQEAVISRTRKMRALWTLEASQDLKAYHNLDLERELTDLLSKELQLEIDRELIEDLRMIAYGFNRSDTTATLGGASLQNMDSDYITLGAFDGLTNATTAAVGTFTPSGFAYGLPGSVPTSSARIGNVFVCDLTNPFPSLSPRHVGEVYANLLAVINLASQDIYKTTMRGPGSWLLTSPLVASLLESAAKLEGGIPQEMGPTNIGNAGISFKGKFAGRYDLYVDPMYPDDEIMVGYKGANAMDAGFIYAPYIPLQQLPTITDPNTFQPRKGILTRYGKVQVEPSSRFYRIIRIIGATGSYLFVNGSRITSFKGNAI